MKCGELMNMNLEWIPGASSVREAAQKMRDLSVGFLLVSNPTPEDAVGVVTDRDLAVRVCAEGLDAVRIPVGQVATVGLVSCAEDDDLADAETRMGDNQKARLVVTDAGGQIVGVLSLTDILRGDHTRRAVRTANAVTAREAHAPVESIHLTPSTPEDEEAASQRDHLVIGGTHGGSMKEFPG